MIRLTEQALRNLSTPDYILFAGTPPNSWDKPADQWEIIAGIELFKNYSSLFLTQPNDRLAEKRDALKRILGRYSRDQIPESGS